MTERDIKRLLTAALRKSDGTLTKFAKQYGIGKYADFYKFYKDMKEDFKKDRENIAFNKIIDMAKSVVGRFKPGLGEFGAMVYVLEVTGYILDNLKRLQKVLNELEEERKQESILMKEAYVLLEQDEDKIKTIINTVAQKLGLNKQELYNEARKQSANYYIKLNKGNTKVISDLEKQVDKEENPRVKKVLKDLIDKAKSMYKDNDIAKIFTVSVILGLIAAIRKFKSKIKK